MVDAVDAVDAVAVVVVVVNTAFVVSTVVHVNIVVVLAVRVVDELVVIHPGLAVILSSTEYNKSTLLWDTDQDWDTTLRLTRTHKAAGESCLD